MGGRGVRDFSRSGKDTSEPGEDRAITGNVGDAGCVREILSGVEISLDIIATGDDVSVDSVETGATTDLLVDKISLENIPEASGDDLCNKSLLPMFFCISSLNLKSLTLQLPLNLGGHCG